MNNRKNVSNALLSFTILVLLYFSTCNYSYSQDKGTLIVRVTGFPSNEGKAILNLFRKTDDIPEEPFKQLKAEIVNGSAIFKANGIPFGAYAAIVFQDENSNGILDHRFGPNEPMGFSNNWTLSLFSGMPTFDKLKLDFTVHEQRFDLSISRK